MKIRLESDKTDWKTSVFPQSWGWGEILVSEKRQVERLSVMENGTAVVKAQIVYGKLPFGWLYAFCPKGPVFAKGAMNKEQGIKALDVLSVYLKKKDCLFFRYEPEFIVKNPLSTIHYQKSIDINPRTTTILDLAKSEDELLAAMHQKTRYNIRLAEKKGLKIISEKKYAVFIGLMKKTGERDGFRLHEEKHYQAIFNSSFSLQLTVVHEEKAVATAVFVGSGDTFTYLFGASDHEYRSLMAPYLLQWEGIKLGKKLGYIKYDFFGIAPRLVIPNSKLETEEYVYDPKHQYAGVTRFKLGFGGSVVETPGTFDLILRPLQYRIYQLLRRLRRLV